MMDNIFIHNNEESGEIEWCKDRIDPDDVEFIRVSKVAGLLAQGRLFAHMVSRNAEFLKDVERAEAYLEEVDAYGKLQDKPGHKYVEKIQEAQRKTREISTHFGPLPDVKEVE